LEISLWHGEVVIGVASVTVLGLAFLSVVLQKRKRICYSREKRAKEIPIMSNPNQNPFKWRHFQSDIILLCVRWYLRYARELQGSRRDDA